MSFQMSMIFVLLFNIHFKLTIICNLVQRYQKKCYRSAFSKEKFSLYDSRNGNSQEKPRSVKSVQSLCTPCTKPMYTVYKDFVQNKPAFRVSGTVMPSMQGLKKEV